MKSKKEKQLTISVCTVTWRTGEMLKICIDALKKSTSLPLEILVMDLGHDLPDKWYKDQGIKLLRNTPPCYFAEANNILAKQATGDYVLFLNPDTVPQKGFLDEMVKCLPKADVIGAFITYPTGQIFHAGIGWEGQERPYHFSWGRIAVEGDRKTYLVLAVCGACLLIKRDLFLKVGGFDKEFRNGYEDVDLCMRIRKGQGKVMYCGSAHIIHHEASTMGTTGKIPTSLEFFDTNFLLLKSKHANLRGRHV